MMSLHLKATMMKTSDPRMFGYMIKVYFKPVFDKYGDIIEELEINPNNGLGEVESKIKNHEKG